MSNSDARRNRQDFPLTIEASEPGLEVYVFNAEDDVVGICTVDQKRIKLILPVGLYTVRSVRCGNFVEEIIRHDGVSTIKAPVPGVFSAATIPGAKTTHEYYTYPAWNVSQTSTTKQQDWNGSAEAGLMLFARAASREAYQGENQFAGLSLRTMDGRELSPFDTDAKFDYDVGWSAYSARLPRGLLIIEDRGDPPRHIPVQLIRGWQTQIFVMHHNRLLWEDMRLNLVSEDQIASRANRDPYDQNADDLRTAIDMDTGFLALQNNTPALAPQMIESFLNSKFQNPLLGLLGAYLMLMNYQHHQLSSSQTSASLSSKPNPDQIRLVLDNLQALMPQSADVAALRIMAKDWVNLPTLGPIDRLPLFRCGAQTLLQAAISNPSLLPESSLLDAVSENLYDDAVWTTWKPISLPITDRIIDATNEPSWVENALIEMIIAVERGSGNISIEEIIRRIGVSPHAIGAAIKTLFTRIAANKLPKEFELRDYRLLSGNVLLELAMKLNVGVDNGIKNLLASSSSAAQQPTMPSKREVYSLLKRTLSEVADKNIEEISASTLLTKLIKLDNKTNLQFFSQLLSRQFRDYNLKVSAEELKSAKTIKDVADEVAKKLNK